MKNLTAFKFEQFRAYWKVRYYFVRFRYWIINQYYSFTGSSKEEAVQTSILWNFFKLSIWNLLLAILFCIGFYFLNEKLCFLFPEKLSETISDSYTTLLGTIAGVSGVFIALYYTGLITAGSAIYSRVPNNIRDLLAKERSGNTYMGFLAFITFFAISLIAINALGFQPMKLAAIFIALLSGISVFVFIYLGRSAFYYFDPTRLSISLIYELDQAISKVTNENFLFLDTGVQSGFNGTANLKVETLKTLAEIVGQELHLNGESFVGFSNQVVNVLVNYEKKKRKIPINSYWFNLKYKHEDWYL